MAFSDADKNNIRSFLGYSGRYAQTDSVLEQAMDTIGTDTNAVTEIQGYITDAQAVHTNLKNLRSQFQVAAVDESRLDLAQGVTLMRQEGRRLCGIIAAKLGVRCRHDYFSPTLRNEAPALGFAGVMGDDNPSGLVKLG